MNVNFFIFGLDFLKLDLTKNLTFFVMFENSFFLRNFGPNLRIKKYKTEINNLVLAFVGDYADSNIKTDFSSFKTLGKIGLGISENVKTC